MAYGRRVGQFAGAKGRSACPTLQPVLDQSSSTHVCRAMPLNNLVVREELSCVSDAIHAICFEWLF